MNNVTTYFIVMLFSVAKIQVNNQNVVPLAFSMVSNKRLHPGLNIQVTVVRPVWLRLLLLVPF